MFITLWSIVLVEFVYPTQTQTMMKLMIIARIKHPATETPIIIGNHGARDEFATNDKTYIIYALRTVFSIPLSL